MNESIEVRGTKELARGTAKLFAQLEDAVPAAFERVSEEIAATVRAQVPHGTGQLAASVSTGKEAKVVSVSIGDEETPYAGWLEFGGSRVGKGGGVSERAYIARGRYLYPAALEVEPQLVAAGEQTTNDEIGRFRWEKPT